MTLRQQKRNQKKVNKPKPVKQVQKKVPNSSKKKTNYSATNKQLTNLSAILKGIVVYKTEIAELHRLLDKYPNEVPVAYAFA